MCGNYQPVQGRLQVQRKWQDNLGSRWERMSILARPTIAQRVGARLQIFTRPFARDRLHPMAHFSMASTWLISEFRHDDVPVSLKTANHIGRKLALSAL